MGSTRRRAPPPAKQPSKAPTTATQQTSGPSMGGGGLGSAIATGMAFGVGSGLGHAAAGSMINAVSGGDEDNGVMYDEYEDNNQGYGQQQQHQQDEHPCVKYWEQFQSCMDMNSDDIG